MLDPKTILAYYSRREIQQAIADHALDKEVVGSINNEHFRKRPDTIQFPADIYALAKQGVTSFHASEERWHNPLLLQPGMQKKDSDKNRKGWDLLLDIDCPEFEFSRVAAFLLVRALQYHEITAISVKFSGNHGFHIGVPYEAFPEQVMEKETRLLFPEAPRLIAAYLKERIRKHFQRMLLEKYSLEEISLRGKRDKTELVKNGEFDPFQVLAIDTILLSSRHLYRMPYSFNEKAGLISLPIPAESIFAFKKEDAEPEKISPRERFLDRNVPQQEARRLLQEAYDYKTPQQERYVIEKRTFNEPQTAVPEQFFPPCIQKMLRGLEDGKKRSLFMLTNFFRSVNWPDEKIEEIIQAWNAHNHEQLRETIIVGHLRYMKQRKEKIMPPNCKSQYEEIGVCCPDSFCSKIKNPAQYAKKKAFLVARSQKNEQKPLREKLTEEQKEMRKKHREQQMHDSLKDAP